MINFSISERGNKLKEQFFGTNPGICSERAKIVTQAHKDFTADPAVIRQAKTLKRVLENVSIWIADNELIVGNQAKKPRYAPIFPEFSFDWIIDQLDQLENEPFELRSADRFDIDEETKNDLRSIQEYWKGKTVNDRVKARLPEETFEAIKTSAVYTFDPDVVICTGIGHYSPNYKTILTKGFLQIKKDAENNIQSMGIPANGRDLDKHNFWRSVIISCEAVIAFAKRYSELAKKMANEETNDIRKKELEEIAVVCERVPAFPASSFHEACQSFYFFQLVLQLESSGHSISPGRFDQYMYPYYKADIESAKLNQEQALEILECLWVKLSEINKIGGNGWAADFYPLFQNLCVGGQTREGQDATNDLSYLCLDASKNIGLHQPSISARIWNFTPEEFWKKVIQVTKTGIGMPALFNDEVIIPGMLNRGKSVEDARDYAIVGCVEPGVQGYEYGWCGGTGDNPFFSMPACLEYALNDGKNMLTGAQTGPKTGLLSDFETFEELQNAYDIQVQYFIDHFTVITNAADLVHQEFTPLPFLSCGMEPCVERGIEVNAGGAKYNTIGTAGVGVSNAGDSLMALKKFVFDEGIIEKTEFLEILKNNWEGQEILRNRILAEVEHYGNDDDDADNMASWVAKRYCEMTEKSMSCRGPYSPGLYPVAHHILMGYGLAASADGRKAREPLADGISPVHGRDTNGPAALLNSAAKLDHFISSNGTLLNMKFHPSAVKGEKGESSLEALMKNYFYSKGLHVQYNVVSSKKLRDAQCNPAKYRDLVVRVAGYSALFVGLHPVIQEDIITRTEIMEMA
jgi:formate C-acetyltransferase